MRVKFLRLHVQKICHYITKKKNVENGHMACANTLRLTCRHIFVCKFDMVSSIFPHSISKTFNHTSTISLKDSIWMYGARSLNKYLCARGSAHNFANCTKWLQIIKTAATTQLTKTFFNRQS